MVPPCPESDGIRVDVSSVMQSRYWERRRNGPRAKEKRHARDGRPLRRKGPNRSCGGHVAKVVGSIYLNRGDDGYGWGPRDVIQSVLGASFTPTGRLGGLPDGFPSPARGAGASLDGVAAPVP